MPQPSEFLSSGLLSAGIGWLVAYVLITTHITIIAVTIYLHRAQAHRSVTLHPALAHAFRFWLWLTTGMVTREWVAVHRRHHVHSDEPGDPHSPQLYGIGRVLSRGTELYQAAAADEELLRRFGSGTPDDWLERKVYSRFVWQGVGLLLVLNVLLFGAPGITAWAVQMLWIPVLAAGVVNGVGHYWGYRNFDCAERATNIVPWGLLIGGEELHNNHHSFVTSPKLSVRWYEFDLGWAYIVLFRALGLATVRPPLPKLAPRPNVAAADHPALLAVLAHRARLMKQLSARLRPVWAAELARISHASSRHRDSLRLLARDPGYLSEAERAQLDALIAHSSLLLRIQSLRIRLAEMWTPSQHTPQQLLARLDAWCTEARHSDCPAMREFGSYLPRLHLVARTPRAWRA